MPSLRSPLRYALVGTGSRALTYVDALTGVHASVGRLVAWADTNPGRLGVHEERLRRPGAALPAASRPTRWGTRCAATPSTG